MSLVMTCAKCRGEVLEADEIGEEEECILRDHLLEHHLSTIQPRNVGRVTSALRRDRGTGARCVGSRPGRSSRLGNRRDRIEIDLGGQQAISTRTPPALAPWASTR